MILRMFLALLLYSGCQTAFAHKASDSYLTLTITDQTATGQWDIALRDLDFAIGLDANDDRAITWQELRNQHALINSYALAHLQLFSGNSPCTLTPQQNLVDNHTDGAYAVLQFSLDCPAPIKDLGIHYSLFFDLDPQHRGLLRIDHKNTTHTAVFSPNQAVQHITLAHSNAYDTFWQYVREGVWHIWKGYDHILFLLSLLLPAVFYRHNHQCQPVRPFRPVITEVVKIVSAFTVAHSITLSLATLGVIDLPTRWVESAIAASVILAAINNLYPLINSKLWLVAFAFGLIHGLGFANVLKDLGLPQELLLWSLLAFNVGVELGQLAIVAGFLPVAFSLRNTWFYRNIVFILGSVLIALLALVWLLERALNLTLLS